MFRFSVVTLATLTLSSAIAEEIKNPRNAVTLSATSTFVLPTAGSGTLSITADQSWTATTSAPWLSVSPASGSGNQTLTYTFTANPLPTARLAAITVNGRVFSVSQPSLPGRFTLWGDTAEGNVYTVSGDGSTSQLNTPKSVVVDTNGAPYIADTDNHRIRKLSPTPATIAGTGAPGFSGDNGPATAAQLNTPSALAIDPAGNLFIADTNNFRIRRIDASTGLITTIAGTGAPGFSGDNGPATAATFQSITALALDPSGNIFLADSTNHRIRRIDAQTGTITTIAGTGAPGFSGDGGPATAAQLNSPSGLALDPSGNIFLADTANNVVRRIDAQTGDIASFATVPLSAPTGLAADSGNLFICDTGNHRVLVRYSNGVTGIEAGAGPPAGFSGDSGSKGIARFNAPHSIARDGSGNSFIADTYNHRVRFVDHSTPAISFYNIPAAIPGSTTSGVIGINVYSYIGGGYWYSSTTAPWLTLTPSANSLSYSALPNPNIEPRTATITVNNKTLTLLQQGAPATAALSAYAAILPATASADSVSVTITPNVGWAATSKQPWLTVTPTAQSVTFTASANPGPLARTAVVTIAGKLLHVTQASPSGAYSPWGKLSYGAATPIAGNGTFAFAGDGGPALSASLNGTNALGVDLFGNVFITDGSAYPRVRKISIDTRTISTVAGNGNYAYSGDGGPATAASFKRLGGITVAPNGNLLIVDPEDSRVRSVDAATGIISTIAGDGNFGFSGDGSSYSTLYVPGTITTDHAGNIFIGDALNHRIRRINGLTSIITTVAGNGGIGVSGDGGPATAATIASTDHAVDAAGNIFISETSNHRIRKVDGATGIITTIAGTGTRARPIPGQPALNTPLEYPGELAVDPLGNLLFRDTGGIYRIDAATGYLSLAFSPPQGVGLGCYTLDRGGNLYFANSTDRRIYFVDFTTPSFSLSATTATVSAAGGSGSLTLTVLPASFKSWTISGAPAWLTVTASPNGAINWTAATNPTTSQRTATLTIGDQLFTLTQPGKAPVGTQPPTLVSVTPATPAFTQTFAITARDLDGADNLARIYFLINPTPTIPTNTCHGFYDRALDAVFLYNDSLSNLSSLSNSQCTINGFTTQSAATNLTLNLTVTRKNQTAANLYLWITDNEANGTGWLSAASWTVAPALLSATPAATSASTQTFTITAANTDRVYFLLHPSPAIPQNTCHGFYDRSLNAAYLYNDALTNLSSLSNSQCAVAAFSATTTGNTLTLNLTLTKKTTPPDNLYVWLTNTTSNGTGWQPVATWALAPTVVSVSPVTTSLPTQTFTITATNLDRIYFLLHPTPTIPQNTCHGFYDRSSNAVFLYNDALTNLSSLSNSQCAVAAFSATTAANIVTLSLTLAKKTTQSANLYLWVTGGTGNGTGWLPVATWNFSNQRQPPALVSVNPRATPAVSQTFTIIARDPDGAANLSRIYFLLNPTPTIPQNTCHGFYDRVLNNVYLYSDGLTNFSSLSNSQCSVDAFNATITSATDLTLNLTLTKKAFPLANFYVWITDNDANGTGWLLASTMATEPFLASITPSTTSVPNQEFRIVMRHPYGVHNFNLIYFMIAPDTISLNQCVLTYTHTARTILLQNDEDPNPVVQSNAQCALNAYSIDLPPDDPTALIITLKLTRKQTTPATLFIGPYTPPANFTRPPVPWIPAATWYP
jgi:sugar lactone lactonase YvrE